MTGTSIMTALLLMFKDAASLGYVTLLSPAMSLAQILITIEIVFLGVYIAFNAVDNLVVAGFKKILSIGFMVYLIENFGYLSNVLLSSLGQAGIIAGGGGITTSMLYDPSAILQMGFTCADTVFDEIGGAWDIITNPIETFFLGIGGAAIIISYFVVACNLLIIVVEYHIFTACAVILIPFGIFKHTKFLSEGVLSGCVKVGVKLMLLAFILCLSYNVLQTLTIPSDPEIKDVLLIFCICASIAWLSSSVPSKVASYITGSPDLSPGVTTGGVMTGAAAGGAAGVYAARKSYQLGSRAANKIRSLIKK